MGRSREVVEPVYHAIAVCRWCGGRFRSIHETQWVCENEGCAQKQIAHATLMPEGRTTMLSPYLYLPTPFGVEMHESRVMNLLGGGAAGGAKSHNCRWDLYQWCEKIEGYEALLMRRTFPELDSTHLARMEREQYLRDGWKFYKQDRRMVCTKNGSSIKAGHCDAASDMQKYLSTEYDDIRIDEASTFERRVTIEISSRARSSKPKVVERGGAFVRLYSNPGGIGASYLRDHYIDKLPDPIEFPGYDARDYGFIRARVTDNPYLDPNYIKRLKQLEPERQRQLMDGDWSVFYGQFFGSFNPATHVVAMEPR